MTKAKRIRGLDAQADARLSMPVIFSTRIEELWSFAPHLHDVSLVRELHDMRIAGKRLRYCFEFYAHTIPHAADPVLERFKRLQDYLGEIHDCDVWAGELSGMLHDAADDLRRFSRDIDGGEGASDLLAESAREIGRELKHGPLAGLLRVIRALARRRAKLHKALLAYWNALEEQGFRAELSALVLGATRSAGRPQKAAGPADEQAAPETGAQAQHKHVGEESEQADHNSMRDSEEADSEALQDADRAGVSEAEATQPPADMPPDENDPDAPDPYSDPPDAQ